MTRGCFHKMKKTALLLLTILLFLCFVPAAGAEWVIDRILCQTLPGNGTVDLPSVGQDYSSFSCRASIEGIHVDAWALVDSDGNPCSGMVENKQYTLYIDVASDDPNYVFTNETRAYINNMEATVTIFDDWHYATIGRVIKPNYLAPTIWHHPTDESHNMGERFDFFASAQPGYTSFEWHIKSPDGRDFKAEEITKLYGAEYSKERKYHTSSKGAQEAHEAIRPTYMDKTSIEGTLQEKRLYELIWKRTAASQMADAEIEKTTVSISIGDQIKDAEFVAQGEVVKFDGFLKVYRESVDLPPLKKGEELVRREIQATERTSQGPQRYTEASLVHKLEELGIGRPSTYAPTISTIQQREYVMKGDKKGEEHRFDVITLKGKQIAHKTRMEIIGSTKESCCLPTSASWLTTSSWLISPLSWTTTSPPRWNRTSIRLLRANSSGTR